MLSIPLFGSMAAALLTPVFHGGWMLAARRPEGGSRLGVSDLFSRSQDKLTPLVVLVALLLGFAVALAMWFAQALAVFRDMPPVDARKASVAAGLKNIEPFLMDGLLYIVASIPFGLGWIVLVPIVLPTVYVSNKDIYESSSS